MKELNIEEFDKYIGFLAENKSIYTAKNYQVSVEKFADANGFTKLEDFTGLNARFFRDYIDGLKTKGESSSYINVQLSALKGWYKWLVKYDYMEETPVREGQVRHKAVREQTWLLPDQITQMLAVTKDPRNKALLSMLFETGMRYSEIVNIHIGDIENRTNTETGVKYYAVWVIGKGNKKRLIGINSNCMILINTYLRKTHPCPVAENYLFVTKTNGILYDSDVNNIIKTAAKEAGVPNWNDIHVHSARHSFASNLLNNGAYPQTVQFAMGHTSLATTAMYAHPDSELVASFMAKSSKEQVYSRETVSTVNVPSIADAIRAKEIEEASRPHGRR